MNILRKIQKDKFQKGLLPIIRLYNKGSKNILTKKLKMTTLLYQ
jgi:hypothetical protein